MVIIRLSRCGKKKQPFYKIIVTDNRKSCKGQFIQKIGYFDCVNFCINKKSSLFFNKDYYKYWLSKGAQVSKRVVYLYKKFLEI